MIKGFSIQQYYILEFGLFGLIKIIFFLLLYYEYIKNKTIGHFARAKYKWSNSFFVKFFTCFFIVINYFSIIFNILEDHQENINYLTLLNIFNSFLWIFCVYMIYFEYIRKMSQKWLGLRTFWIFNFIFNLVEIILLLLKVDYDKKKSIFSKLLFYQIIQFIPSIILFIFSIFKPNDQEFNLIKNSFDEVNNILENNNNVSNIEDESLFLELQISNINSNKFEMKNNVLLSIKNKDENLNKKNNLENLSVKFNLKLFGQNYSINKTIFDLISFNKKIIENSKNKINNYDKINKGYLIQIDNINIIFEKNIENETKFKELKNIYINLIKNYNFFISDFIDFCNIKNDEIKNKIQNQYLNNNNNSFSLNLSNTLINLNKENLIKPDIIKAIEFISYIIINDKKIINIKINKLINSQIINQCFFDCEYYYKNKKYPIQLKLNDLIEYSKNNFKIKSSEKIILIQNFLNDFENIKNIFENNLNEKIIYFQDLLENILNNIFFYDDLFFKIFKINDLINLDSDKLNIETINYFFELDNYFMNNNYFNNSIFDTLINNKKLKIIFDKKIENNKFNIIINYSEKNVNNILDLNELLLECKDIIQINKNFNRFDNLKNILENIINLINNENENKINEIINLLNQFCEKENFYIFYSIYFRTLFKLGNFNENSEDLNNEINNNEQNNNNNNNNDDELNESMNEQNEILFKNLIS
jgi:hypothetical protein